MTGTIFPPFPWAGIFSPLILLLLWPKQNKSEDTTAFWADIRTAKMPVVGQTALNPSSVRHQTPSPTLCFGDRSPQKAQIWLPNPPQQGVGLKFIPPPWDPTAAVRIRPTGGTKSQAVLFIPPRAALPTPLIVPPAVTFGPAAATTRPFPGKLCSLRGSEELLGSNNEQRSPAGASDLVKPSGIAIS